MKNFKFVICAAATLGCYSYVPMEVDQVPLQTEVRAVLSTAGEINLRERVGLVGGRLTGELVERSADQLMIAVPTTGPFTGATGEQLYQRIDIARADVLVIERKEPANGRTAALVIGSVGAAAAATIIVFIAERNPGEGPSEPPGPDERIGIRLPYLLRY